MIWYIIGAILLVVCLIYARPICFKDVIIGILALVIAFPTLIGCVVGTFIKPNVDNRYCDTVIYNLQKLDDENYIWYTRNGNIIYRTNETGVVADTDNYNNTIELTKNTPCIVKSTWKNYVAGSVPWWFANCIANRETSDVFYVNTLDRTIF